MNVVLSFDIEGTPSHEEIVGLTTIANRFLNDIDIFTFHEFWREDDPPDIHVTSCKSEYDSMTNAIILKCIMHISKIVSKQTFVLSLTDILDACSEKSIYQYHVGNCYFTQIKLIQ